MGAPHQPSQPLLTPPPFRSFLPQRALNEINDWIGGHSPGTNPIPHPALACVELHAAAAPAPGAPAPRRVFCTVDMEAEAPDGHAILPEWMFESLGAPSGVRVTLCA